MQFNKLLTKPTNIPGKSPPKAAVKIVPIESKYNGAPEYLINIDKPKFNPIQNNAKAQFFQFFMKYFLNFIF